MTILHSFRYIITWYVNACDREQSLESITSVISHGSDISKSNESIAYLEKGKKYVQKMTLNPIDK